MIICTTDFYFLLQSASGARQLLKHIDPRLGEPMEEKDYGGNCHLYDHDRPDDPFHNIKVSGRTRFCRGLPVLKCTKWCVELKAAAGSRYHNNTICREGMSKAKEVLSMCVKVNQDELLSFDLFLILFLGISNSYVIIFINTIIDFENHNDI